MEEEGEPKDPVVEAALDQGLGTRKRGLGGPLADFSTLKMPMPPHRICPKFTGGLTSSNSFFRQHNIQSFGAYPTYQFYSI